MERNTYNRCCDETRTPQGYTAICKWGQKVSANNLFMTLD